MLQSFWTLAANSVLLGIILIGIGIEILVTHLV